MKKLLGLMAALIVSTSAVFAGGYKGDFQLLFGAGFDSTTLKLGDLNTGFGIMRNCRETYDTGLFTMDFETWHVFGSNDVFKFGFMVGYDFGIGGTTKYGSYADGGYAEEAEANDRFLGLRTGLFIAPAFSFFIGDAVRFNIAPGLSILFSDMGSMISRDTYENTITFFENAYPAIGAGIELQAKFCPNAKVSPVLAYRFTANFADSMASTSSGNNSKTITKVDSVVILTNSLKVGITWNW